MYETGCTGLVHWDEPEGWDEEGGGREGQGGEHTYTHGWFMWMYGKNHHNIVISLQLKFKNKEYKKERKMDLLLSKISIMIGSSKLHNKKTAF